MRTSAFNIASSTRLRIVQSNVNRSTAARSRSVVTLRNTPSRFLSSPSSSSSSSSLDFKDKDERELSSAKSGHLSGKRVWKGNSLNDDVIETDWCDDSCAPHMTISLKNLLQQLEAEEATGGRMRSRQLGVLREDAADDIRLLSNNYTVPALAAALREREELLQYCANMLATNQQDKLSQALQPFESRFIKERRSKHSNLDLKYGFTHQSLEMIRRALMKMPRRVTFPHSKRASVVVPLCNVDGVPCILFEKRSAHVRSHPHEVCLPGGMVASGDDKSIIDTSLREMEEEICILRNQSKVIGILRCNWGEVASLTGIAVTPVVCYIDSLNNLNPNQDEVAECFTVPLSSILEKERWIYKENAAPIFTGAPHIIWGLTGYIVDRFVKDVLARYTIDLPPR